MSRPKKSARLWLRPERRSGDGRIIANAVWIIIDGGKHVATGCGKGEDQAAERALAEFIRSKYQPARQQRSLEAIPIADVISVYLDDRSPPEERAAQKLAERCGRLLDFWGDKSLAEITGANCREYAKKRGNAGGARRDLEDLRAAVGYHKKEGFHREDVSVTLPARGDARTRWLTREEAAKLLWSAWRAREKQGRERGNKDADRLPTKRKTLQHVARFILIGLYTGSRAGAIATASWERGTGKSFIDLEAGIFYRHASGKRQTNKRQPPVPLPSRLLAHMRRWKSKRISATHVVEWQGLPVQSVKTGFSSAVEKAKLGDDVTPHTLRHTAVTWLMQAGASFFETGGFVGMSPQMIERVYGHHHPEHLRGAAAMIGNPTNKKPMKRRDKTGLKPVEDQLNALVFNSF